MYTAIKEFITCLDVMRWGEREGREEITGLKRVMVLFIILIVIVSHIYMCVCVCLYIYI